MKPFASIAVALLLSAPAAVAAERIVELESRPHFGKNLKAYPHIVGAADAAEEKINKALDRLDANVLKASAECRKEGGKDAFWERNVETPMRGPRYLSYVISDFASCGGAHPNVDTMAIVYDLATGAPVDWTKLLPPALTGKVALGEMMDGTKMVNLSSTRLHALYVREYEKGGRKTDADCKEVVKTAASEGAPAMQVWLDAKQGGLGLFFSVAHAVAACIDPVVIPAAVLKAEGTSAALVDAIGAAQVAEKGGKR